jgi:hypothetical protein
VKTPVRRQRRTSDVAIACRCRFEHRIDGEPACNLACVLAAHAVADDPDTAGGRNAERILIRRPCTTDVAEGAQAFVS